MHILIAVFGALGAAAFWWYRLKVMGDAAVEVTDAVGRARGHFRRKTLRRKAAISPITAIDDPVTAAATVMLAIAAEDRLVTPDMQERLRDEITAIAPEKTEEAPIYAKWACEQVDDVPVVIDRTAEFLASRLTGDEKEHLVVMAGRVAGPDRPPHYRQRIERLRRKLGLVVA